MHLQASSDSSTETKSLSNLSNILQQSSLLTARPSEEVAIEAKIVEQKTLLPFKPVLAELDSQGGIRIDITIPASAFTLGRLLGKGGFGIVYEGVYNGKPVAIKQLSAHLSVETLKELRQEAEIMFQLGLESDYIVPLKKICLEPPHYSLIMELMPKGSLYDLLRNGQELPWTIRFQIAQDAAWGLEDLHEYKILHRDLKSLNILLGYGFRAKLADFGLAKVKHETGSQSSVAKGTVLWMAPELFDDTPKMTTASDVYSFGMVLWELVTRLLPYAKAPNQMVAARWIEKGKKEEIPSNCPPELKSIIESCWESIPEKRPTAIQLVERLKPLVTTDEKAKKLEPALSDAFTSLEKLQKPKDIKQPGEEEYQQGIIHYTAGRYSQATRYFQSAADKKYPAAYVRLAVIYKEGRGTSKDIEAAHHWSQKIQEQIESLQSQANLGVAAMQEALGMCHKFGYGVTKDEKEAFKWFAKAAEQKYPLSLNTMG